MTSTPPARSRHATIERREERAVAGLRVRLARFEGGEYVMTFHGAKTAWTLGLEAADLCRLRDLIEIVYEPPADELLQEAGGRRADPGSATAAP